MNTCLFYKLPEDAKQIREEVFVKEQGFRNEFDDIDARAMHLVLYDDELPVATCRLFSDDLPGDYVVGRIAVIKEYRGKNIGTYLLKAAEEEIRKMGGKRIIVHAQSRVKNFYEKQGYYSLGKNDFDEDCPHVWMAKELRGVK